MKIRQFIARATLAVLTAAMASSALAQVTAIEADPAIVRLPEQRSETDDPLEQVYDSYGLRLLKSETSEKVMVTEVIAKGRGESSGLRPGDVIIGVEGREVTNAAGLARFLMAMKGSERATLTVERAGKTGKLLLAAEPGSGEGEVAELPGNQKNILGMTLIKDPQGRIVVENVTPESAAATAGVKAGDRLLSLGDKQPESFEKLFEYATELLPKKQGGEEIGLRVMRDEEPLAIRVVLPQEPQRVPYDPQQYSLPRTQGSANALSQQAPAEATSSGAAVRGGAAGFGANGFSGGFIGALPSAAMRNGTTISSGQPAGAVAVLHRVHGSSAVRGGNRPDASQGNMTGGGFPAANGTGTVQPSQGTPGGGNNNNAVPNNAVPNNAVPNNATGTQRRPFFQGLPADFEGPLPGPNGAGSAANGSPMNRGPLHHPGTGAPNPGLPPDFEGPLPGPGQPSTGRPVTGNPSAPGLPPDFEGPLPGPGQPSTGHPATGNPSAPGLPPDFEGPLPGPGNSGSGSGGANPGGGASGGGTDGSGSFNVQDDVAAAQQQTNAAVQQPGAGAASVDAQQAGRPVPANGPNATGTPADFEGPLPGPTQESERAERMRRGNGISSQDHHGGGPVGFVAFLPAQRATGMFVHIEGMEPGQYVLAVHQFGDCGDLSHFSAGQVERMLGAVIVREDGRANLQTPIQGLELSQVVGRSVLLHRADALDIGSPVACGIAGFGHPGRALMAMTQNGAASRVGTRGDQQGSDRLRSDFPNPFSQDQNSLSPRGVPQTNSGPAGPAATPGSASGDVNAAAQRQTQPLQPPTATDDINQSLQRSGGGPTAPGGGADATP